MVLFQKSSRRNEIKCQQETSESFLKLLFQFQKHTKYGRNETMKKRIVKKRKTKRTNKRNESNCLQKALGSFLKLLF